MDIKYGSTRVVATTFREREEQFRRTLDGGGCIYVGDRWFGPDTTWEERNRYLRSYNRRLDRNRRRRQRRWAQEALEEFERYLESLPAWAQTRIAGRTAVVETVNGQRRAVDYAKTYAPRGGGAYSLFPMRSTFTDLRSIGGFAAWSFVRRVFTRKVAVQCGRETEDRPTPPTTTRHRLRNERRKLCARSTLANCPTATDIRVAWEFVRESYENMLRLGGLLHDLECFVANELHVISVEGKPKICGRSSGIRGWIRENCPELAGKYKTLMRYKSLAKRFRQATETYDPIPTSTILDDGAHDEELFLGPVNVQPRASGERQQRFAWESGYLLYDANDRPYLTNENYNLSSNMMEMVLKAAGNGCPVVVGESRDSRFRISMLLKSARSIAREILSGASTSGEYARQTPYMASLWRHVDLALTERERWWSRN